MKRSQRHRLLSTLREEGARAAARGTSNISDYLSKALCLVLEPGIEYCSATQ